MEALISNPAADPHAYEPTAADARAVAEANLVISNGVGYDPWMDRLLAADGVSSAYQANAPHVLTVDLGAEVGARPGDNPHLWYDPQDVTRASAAITRDLQRLDPADSAYFARRLTRFLTVTLAPYQALLRQIRAGAAHAPVGASESIFAPLAPALGLDLVTAASFLRAISEGTDPAPADLRIIDRQLRSRAIAVYVLNTQNETPDVTRQVALAQAEHIPVVAITETLTPASASFADWQVRQLRALAAALLPGSSHG